jgi:CBS domain-containing protein
MAKSHTPYDPAEFQDPLENFEHKIYTDPLEKALAEESVVAIQHQPVATVAPNTLVGVAIQKLADLHVACLLVQVDDRLVGVFSDRNVLDKAGLEFDEVKNKPVSDLMTPDPVFVYESDSAAAALCVMAVCGFRHVPVTDVSQKVVGIVSPQRVTAFLRKHMNA